MKQSKGAISDIGRQWEKEHPDAVGFQLLGHPDLLPKLLNWILIILFIMIVISITIEAIKNPDYLDTVLNNMRNMRW